MMRTQAVCGVLTVAWCGLVAMAQPAAPAGPAPAALAPAAEPVSTVAPGLTAEKLLARRMALTARVVLMGDVSEARLGVGRAMLEQAVRLDPANPEWWRLLIEAAELAQDKAGLRTALGGYLRADPADDAAQWRLIQLMVEDQQTAAGRVALYERLLPSAQLSKPLRSRIAFAACTLKRDSGDLTGYAQLLKQAITLDEANAPAAAEAYALLQERGGTQAEVAQALFNLVMADPTDPGVQAQVASTMLAAGQHRRAAEWFESASGLWPYRGMPGPDSLVVLIAEWATALWGGERGADAVKLIEGVAAGMRGKNPDAVMPAAMSSVLTAIQTAAGNEDGAGAAFAQLQAAVEAVIAANPNDPGPLADMVWAHVLFNRKLDVAADRLARLEKLAAPEHGGVKRLRGWLLLRQGKTREAQQVLAPLAASDGLADFGLCLIEGYESQPERVARLNRVFTAGPGTTVGVMADAMLRQLGGRGQVAGDALTVARLEQHIPDKVRKIAGAPLQFVIMKLHAVRSTVSYGEPIEAEIELTNVSTLPLSMGPGGVINGSVVLSTGLSLGGKQSDQRAVSVARLDRRLRLEPGTSLTVRVLIDSEPVASVLLDRPLDAFHLRTTAVLNPVPRPQGGFAPGLLGSSQTEKGVERVGWKPTGDTVSAGLRVIAAGDPASRVLTMGLLMRIAPMLAGSFAKEGDRMSDALIKAFQAWTPVEQAGVITFIGNNVRSRQLYAPVIETAVRSDDVVMQYAVITTLAINVESPVLLAALRREGPIHDFAVHWRKLLEAASATRATDSAKSLPSDAAPPK